MKCYRPSQRRRNLRSTGQSGVRSNRISKKSDSRLKGDRILVHNSAHLQQMEALQTRNAKLERQLQEQQAQIQQLKAAQQVCEVTAQQSEIQLHDILQHANAVISRFHVLADRTWGYAYISAGCERVLGYTYAEFIADRHLWNARVPVEDWASADINGYIEAIMAECSFTVEYRFQHKAGHLCWIKEQMTSRYDADRQLWEVTAVAMDISDRKQLELALTASENRLNTILDSAIAVVGSFRQFPDGTYQFTYLSEGCEVLFGYSAANFIVDPQIWENRLHPEELVAFFAQLDPIIEASSSIYLEYRFQHKSGFWRWIGSNYVSQWQEAEQCWVVTFIDTDITQRKQAEIALQELNQQLEARVQERTQQLLMALAASRMGIWQRSLATNIEFWSPGTLALLGLQQDKQGQLLDLSHQVIAACPSYELFTSFIYKEDIDHFVQVQQLALQERSPYELEYRIVRRDGNLRWVYVRGDYVYSDAGEPIAVTGVVMDITQRKQAEEDLRASLREKEVLLKEIHHRVKNNLQMVSSLLNLQSSGIQSTDIRALFAESQRRIQAIAAIHERLYQSHNLSRIDFAFYLKALAQDLLKSALSQYKAIQLNLELEPIEMEIDLAIPCGLIINELITNALKHAFAQLPGGTLTLRFHAAGDRHFTLSVQDDGCGFPTDLDPHTTDSLGLQLVCALTQQLSGQIELDRHQGTTFTLTFPTKGLAGK